MTYHHRAQLPDSPLTSVQMVSVSARTVMDSQNMKNNHLLGRIFTQKYYKESKTLAEVLRIIFANGIRNNKLYESLLDVHEKLFRASNNTRDQGRKRGSSYHK